MGRKITQAQKQHGPKPGVPHSPKGGARIEVYPDVLSEQETLRRIAQERMSIARFGDGELRIASNGTSITQREVPTSLREEVRNILAGREDRARLLVGIPNICSPSPKQGYWLKYATAEYVGRMKADQYASTWITRSDEAPWINTPDYWGLMRSLWREREVILVAGTNRSLRPEDMAGEGAKVTLVEGPRAEAYQEIDRIEREVCRTATKDSPVLLCLGVTATVLAARLARKGLWAVDLGHVGMFMRRSHVLPVQVKSLITDRYAATLRDMHIREPWGCSGWKYVADVVEFYRETGSTSLLDYGSGSETLARDMQKVAPEIEVEMYDPGVTERMALPLPADIVVCTDVMEHIEPELVDAVTDHILSLARRGVYFSIALGGSKQTLPDGRNAHIMVRPKDWWIKHLERWKQSWKITKVQDKGSKQVLLWLEPSTALSSAPQSESS